MAARFAMPPINVRVQHADGSYTAVETVFTGNREGVNHWHSIRAVELKDGDETVWDELPADTAIHLTPKD